MISDIRRLYNKTSTREKFLLLLFIGGIALVWLLYSGTRCTDGFKVLSLTRDTIKAHQDILAQEDYVTVQLLERSSELDASKTLSSTELVGRVSQLIDPLGLRYSINSPQSEEGTLFTFHTLRLTINKAEMESVLKLSDSLKTLVPYVTVERVQVTADRSNQTLLDIQFYISSIEMNAS
tara:strand:- start:8160 stop:8696 length:537 start_codon:yes stop_codon:yes gene_type:complete